MQTKQIEYILELAETGNFNHAAENLYVSQPTVTYQIRSAEDEIGFKIFERSGKGASLTPAGAQFVVSLRNIYAELKNAIEQGQNFSAKFQEDIRIVMPIRSAVYFLPDAIRRMMDDAPSVSVSPSFDWYHGKESFLNGNQDILFSMESDMNHVPDVKKHHLFNSRIYLVCRKDDALSGKRMIETKDLTGRTLMVGGPSPAPLRAVQNRVVQETRCDCFNSHDHDTSLINVAAGRGVVLSPGFLNDHTGEFVWIPFSCEEIVPCALYTHAADSRWNLMEFIRIIREFYQKQPDFPV